ncbi:MAG TPA: molybdopterin-guanine dinucleotide biosynthesis protein B [Acetobacteraceae bacterium]|nr:molybdopterin-guanine dinucleotide biosynthesis protein B [Acetobacteraceae bacterium]
MKFVGFVGSSGSGKTTLIAQVLPLLRRSGLRVSTIKHAHHGFDLDRPGKDSYRHREAGAEEVMLVSGERWALLREQRGDDDVSLHALARRMTQVDLLLVEGFKLARVPKIEVYRPSLRKPPLFPDDPDILAVASNVTVETAGRPCLSLDDPGAVAAFIVSQAMGAS